MVKTWMLSHWNRVKRYFEKRIDKRQQVKSETIAKDKLCKLGDRIFNGRSRELLYDRIMNVRQHKFRK
jgi:hypothetical protein